MMNICFFANNYSYTGGLERVLSLVASELAKTNTVHVVSMYDLQPQKNNNEYAPNVKIHILFKGKKKYVKHIVPTIKSLKRYILDNEIDILIATSEFLGPYSYFACRNTDVKNIVWTHTPTTNFDEAKIQKGIKAISFKKADYIITLTPESKRELLEYYKRKEVIDIPNPIDPRLINNNKYNITSKKIITVGRICYQKNLEKALEVADIVLHNNDDWIWDVYGDGDKEIKESLLRGIKEKKLTNRFNIKGNINNLYEKYNEYAMLVMTSRYEGFPMVLLEGIANRLPLISFDISTGANLLIENNKNGYLVKPFNEIEMASSIQRLIDDVKLRKEMSKQNEILIEKFNIENICGNWNKFLKEVLKNEK